MRATTSVGADLEEARAAETKKDFVHKASLARKESLEAHYWARLLLADAEDPSCPACHEINEIAAILTAIVRRSRESPAGGGPNRRHRKDPSLGIS